MQIVAQVGGGFNEYYFFIAVWNDAGTYRIWMIKAVAVFGIRWQMAPAMTECITNKWYRIAFIRHNQDGFIYQDYKLIGSALGNLISNELIHYGLYVGKINSSVALPSRWHHFDGHIDNLSYSLVPRLPYGAYKRLVNYPRNKTLIGR